MSIDKKRISRIQISIGIAVLVGLGTWALSASLKVGELQKREERCRVRINLIKLQQALLVPSEVIYYHSSIRKELDAVRIKGYERYGVEELIPYHFVRSPDRVAQYVPTTEESLCEWGLEHCLLGHCRKACRDVISDIKYERGVGIYLKQNPAVYDAHVRPLVIRLLDTYSPFYRMEACETLLAMGDRSEEVLEILLLARGAGTFSADIIEKYGLEVEPPGEPAYDRVSSWKRTHVIVNQLKKKYPLKPRTIIQDWDRYCFQ
jgi:hypothetical protein